MNEGNVLEPDDIPNLCIDLDNMVYPKHTETHCWDHKVITFMKRISHSHRIVIAITIKSHYYYQLQY